MIKISLSFNPLKIFISSSWKGDLKEEIKITENAIKSLNLKPITGDSGSEVPVKLHSTNRVKDSDILVLILGEKFSEIVELEYYKALENHIPVLAFVKEVSIKEEKLKNFIENLKINLTYSKYSNVKNLRKQLRENLMGLISERYRHYQTIYETVLKWINSQMIRLPKKILDKLNKEY